MSIQSITSFCVLSQFLLTRDFVRPNDVYTYNYTIHRYIMYCKSVSVLRNTWVGGMELRFLYNRDLKFTCIYSQATRNCQLLLQTAEGTSTWEWWVFLSLTLPFLPSYPLCSFQYVSSLQCESSLFIL